MKKVTLSHPALVMWLFMIAFYGLPVQGLVQFKFNTPDLVISEGEILSNELSILKTGENAMNITFQVRVMPGTAMDGTDYISNSGEPYVFTSSTRQLPISTELVGDRAGEPIETFTICLPEAQVLQSVGAEAVDPMCVTITIVDDDSVVIGFKNSFEVIIEGGTKTICAEVKPEGLRLDPFDRVPLTIRINPALSEAQLSTNSLTFEMSIIEICTSVSVADNDNMEGSRSYQLILDRNGASTVPVELYPNIIPIIVIDNDGPDANFSINSPQSVFIVREGDRIDNIQVQKSNSTVLSYNIPLMVTGSTNIASSSDVRITNSLLFNPSTILLDVGEIEILDDSSSGSLKEFNISIGESDAINYNIPGVQIAIVGDPVMIIVYDNDFKVGFIDDITSPKGTNDIAVCVKIFEPSDIDPTINIPLQILTKNTTAGSLELKVNQVLLNSTNDTGCFTAAYPDGSEDCEDFIIQLIWIRPSNPDYSVIIEGDSDKTISQACPTSGPNRAAIAIGICIPLIAIIATIGIVVTVVFVVKKKISDNKKPKRKQDNYSLRSHTQSSKGDEKEAATHKVPTVDHEEDDKIKMPSQESVEIENLTEPSPYDHKMKKNPTTDHEEGGKNKTPSENDARKSDNDEPTETMVDENSQIMSENVKVTSSNIIGSVDCSASMESSTPYNNTKT